jgi:hypothetical protein
MIGSVVPQMVDLLKNDDERVQLAGTGAIYKLAEHCK